MHKNRIRLYVTLQHRNGRPGFHWDLVLAPKHESRDIKTQDCYLVHATNSLHPDFPIDNMGKVPWRLEMKTINGLRSTENLIGRILVAKLSKTTPIETWREHISALVQAEVPIVQNDPTWTCRVWLLHALERLRNSGGDFATIPDVANHREEFERNAVAFGDEAMKKILQGSGVPKHVTQLPHTDMRVK